MPSSTVIKTCTPIVSRCVQTGTHFRLLAPPQQRRCFSILAKSKDEIATIREHLRNFGSTEDSVSLQLASELEHSSSLSKLGSTTALITLKNPASRNALTGKMMAELADTVDILESNESFQKSLTAVIVRGDAGFFCAGADIGVAKDHLLSSEGGRLMSTVMIDTLTRFRHLPFVTVAAIEGMAVGGGAELTTAMDYRIINKEAKLRFVHAHMGVSPGWGGATRLVRLIGRNRALELLGTAQPSDSDQSLKLGLVDEIVSSDSTMDDTLVTFLDRFIHAHPGVLHAAKEVVAGVEDAASFEEAVANEHEVFLKMWGGEANLAALTKAKTKKPKK